jgi:hypothetical protein
MASPAPNSLASKVWIKAFGYNSGGVGTDEMGSVILYSHYGDRNSSYGWEIDHIIFESRGGSDDLSNLRPLQWRNNASRQP